MSEPEHGTNEPERGSSGWQLSQSAPEAYEQYLVPPMFEPWADRLIDRVGLRSGDRVLDVGCGTGIVARRAASRLGDEGTVVGLDVNDGMLDVARATASENRLSIDWRQGEATELPFVDESFEVVVSQQALQFVSEPRAALREIRRVLVPSGRVAVSVWRPLRFNPGYVELAEVLESYVGDDAGVTMRSPFPTWNREVLRTLARDAGFDDRATTIEIGSTRYPSAEEFVRREAASSPLSEPLGDIESDVREALVEEVGRALEDYTDDEGITFPMESYVLTARRRTKP